MNTAKRFTLLGTETAFAVAEEARQYAEKGVELYPFHLGDMNLKTPGNIVDAAVKAIEKGKTGYCSNYGIPELREALAAEVNRSHGTSYTSENVAVEPGGKPVISKFFLALMNPGDEALYPSPGYPIYESAINFHGGKPVPYPVRERDGNFFLDPADIVARITPGTRFLVLNNFHNPTGAESNVAEMAAICQLAVRKNLSVLCDEAYFDITYGITPRSFVSFPGMAERSIILYTFSKKYAMTGWRLGAAVGPKEIIDAIAKLNVNDESCTNHFVQYAGLEALTGPQDGARQILSVLKERRDLCRQLLNDIPGVVCGLPDSTFYLFARVTELMRRLGYAEYEPFRRAMLAETGVSFCTRLHFGRALPGEKDRYIRFSYSGIDIDRIREGLGRLKQYVLEHAVVQGGEKIA